MGVIVRVVRAAAAVLGVVAISVALAESTGTVANFVSFFTIESNILAVVVFAGGALLTRPSPGWAYFRGAVTLYMTITGIVYAALLSDVDVQLTSQWVNSALHQVLPVLLLLDWLALPPWPRLPLPAALGWLAFPLAYFGYSLIRGPHAHFYPYPFLDPRPYGYGHVAVYAVLLAVFFALLAVLIARIGLRRRESVAGQDDVEARPRPGTGYRAPVRRRVR
jgi:hypothetical protein